MQQPLEHILELAPSDANYVRLLDAVQNIVGGVKERYSQCASEKVEYYNQLQATNEQLDRMRQSLPAPAIVADGKQKELVAILSAIYDSGYFVHVTKKDFMQRMADCLGCPGIANYNQHLYNIKNTYKYDEIFDKLAKVAHDEILQK